MEREEFLKRLGLSSMIMPFIAACDNDTTPDGDGLCASTSAETAGPFPTKSPSSMVMVDVTSDRTGIGLVINITVQDKSNDCAPLEGALVDIWHCDKDGYYSEYGGTGLQSVDLTGVHFLRGRQVTDSNGLAAFTSIFLGWYPGRAPHIHVHIFDSSGKSLLVTQIAFPTGICNSVYTTATQFYTKGTQDTSNAGDNVFANSLANEISLVTGNTSDGYILTHTIVVNA